MKPSDRFWTGATLQADEKGKGWGAVSTGRASRKSMGRWNPSGGLVSTAGRRRVSTTIDLWCTDAPLMAEQNQPSDQSSILSSFFPEDFVVLTLCLLKPWLRGEKEKQVFLFELHPKIITIVMHTWRINFQSLVGRDTDRRSHWSASSENAQFVLRLVRTVQADGRINSKKHQVIPEWIFYIENNNKVSGGGGRGGHAEPSEDNNRESRGSEGNKANSVMSVGSPSSAAQWKEKKKNSAVGCQVWLQIFDSLWCSCHPFKGRR